MSAYAKYGTQYKDKECLIKALADQGYTEVEYHEVATNLFGYHGDKRKDVANIIVRRKFVGNAANDIGFIKTNDGTYSAIISQFDSGKHNASWMLGLKKAYTEAAGRKEAKRQGLKPWKTLIDANGNKQILFMKA